MILKPTHADHHPSRPSPSSRSSRTFPPVDTRTSPTKAPPPIASSGSPSNSKGTNPTPREAPGHGESRETSGKSRRQPTPSMARTTIE